MFLRQAHPWKVHCCCRFYLTVVGRTRMSLSAPPRGSTDPNSYSVATLARNALSTMEISLALSSARRYESNWNRFTAFLPTLDRKRHYLPGSPNKIILFVQHFKEEGKTPSNIRTYLSNIAERHNAYLYPVPTTDYLF